MNSRPETDAIENEKMDRPKITEMLSNWSEEQICES
jgi:hypothetical protein